MNERGIGKMNEVELNDYRTGIIVKVNQYRKKLKIIAPFHKEIEYWSIRWDGANLKVEKQDEVIIQSSPDKTSLHAAITLKKPIPHFLLNIFNFNTTFS